MSWNDKDGLIPNELKGRPDKTNTDAEYMVRAGPLNQNFNAAALAIGLTQALGTECVDNGSTSTTCKLKLPAGRWAAGDRVTVLENRPSNRTWSALVSQPGDSLLLEFSDSDLNDSTQAGLTDYDEIQPDLLIVGVAQQDKPWLTAHGLVCGGAHGLDGSDVPWKHGEADSIADKFDSLTEGQPGGGDGAVQFNDDGQFGGDEESFAYDDTRKSIIVGNGNTTAGNANAAVGGRENSVSADMGGVFCGRENEVDVDYGVCLGGHENKATANWGAACLTGYLNEASGPNAVCLGGIATKAPRDGQISFNSTPFSQVTGEVQCGIVTLGGQIEEPNSTYLSVGFGGGVTGVFELEDGKTYHWRAWVVARQYTTGVSAAWKCEGLAERTGGVSRDVGTPSVTLVAADTGASSWGLTAGVTSQTNSLDFIGSSGSDITRWYCRLEWEEVAF